MPLAKSLQNFSNMFAFDLFAFTPNILFNGKPKHKSCLGIIVTYVNIAITLLAFFFFGQELVLRENPNLIITENRLELNTPVEIDFNKEGSLQLAFGIFDTDQLIAYDKTYFNITGEKRSYYYKEKGFWQKAIKFFEISTCSLEY